MSSSTPVTIGRAFALGRQPWRTLDPFLFCAYHDDKYPASHGSSLGPDPKTLRQRDIGSDFSYTDGWSMYHGETVPGFPSHPHHGFETVTITRKGLVDHFDSLGATGRYGNGDVQWLTTGDGVQHSEMFPLLNQKEANPLEIFQLWLNLPKAKKSSPPYFEMFWAPNVPVTKVGDADVKVVAGNISGAQACTPPPNSWAADPENEVAIWIAHIKADGRVTLPAAANGSAINRSLYFFKGGAKRVTLGASGEAPSGALNPREGQQVDAGRAVELSAEGGDAEVLVMQGRPIKEPVVQRGPFVTNSNEDLMAVYAKYHRTQYGGWPWPSHDYTHPREQPRMAKRPGQKDIEYPPKAE